MLVHYKHPCKCDEKVMNFFYFCMLWNSLVCLFSKIIFNIVFGHSEFLTYNWINMFSMLKTLWRLFLCQKKVTRWKYPKMFISKKTFQCTLSLVTPLLHQAGNKQKMLWRASFDSLKSWSWLQFPSYILINLLWHQTALTWAYLTLCYEIRFVIKPSKWQ